MNKVPNSKLSLFGSSESSSAIISPCEKYRYLLERRWGDRHPTVCFVMLNPSTADADTNDATITRCIAFARSWGYDALSVVNLFAYRATDPKELRSVDDPIGPYNDLHIEHATRAAQMVLCGWGNHGLLHDRGNAVRRKLRYPWCIAVNGTGQPAHPLYQRSDRKPVMLPYQTIDPKGLIFKCRR